MTSRIRAVLVGALTGAIVAFTGGCADEPSPLAPRDANANMVAAARFTPAMNALGRALAMTLANPEMRQMIKNDMRNSLYQEHKIDLSAYLKSSQRGRMSVEVARHMSRGVDGLSAALAGLPGLEVYFPVPRHRNQWDGTEPVIVVVQRADDNDVLPRTAFDGNGRKFSVSAERAPETPTVVIGFQETDFSRPPDRQGWTNSQSNGGLTIGSWVPKKVTGEHVPGDDMQFRKDECPPEAIVECGDDSGGGVWSLPADHTFQRAPNVREFIHQMWTPNDHEPWDKGAPEFELYIAGTTDTDGDAELKTTINIPRDPWCGSNDSCNNTPREFGPEYLVVGEWDTDYGDRLGVKCLEHDTDWSWASLNLEFSSKIAGVTVTVSAGFSGEKGNNDDDCGEATLRLRSASTGAWTTIYNAVDGDPAFYHGTSDLRWWGYARPIP